MTIRTSSIPDDVNASNRGEILPSDWNAVAAQLNAMGTASTKNIDTDGTLAANSDTRIATQKATKTYVDSIIPSLDALVYKGVIDCSGNPNYPAGDAGHVYKISVAGKIGGASGINVEVNDMVLCTVDGSAAGTQAAVGANWDPIQSNIDGAVTGPASATSTAIAIYNGTSGKIIQGSTPTIAAGVITATGFSGPLAGNADTATLAATSTIADAASDTTTWLVLSGNQTGSNALLSDATLTFNASTNALTTTTFIGALTGNASTATALANPRTIGGVSFDGTAAIVPQTIQSINEATDTTCFPLFISASGSQSLQPLNNVNLTFNSNTGALGASSMTATTFTGALSGNATTATTATNIGVTDAASDTTTWVLLAGSQTGNQAALSDAGLTYNSSTDTLTTTTFSGALSGNATTATTATNANNINVVDAASDTTTWVVLAGSQTGNQNPLSDATLTFNASTNALTTTTFIGALTGNADTATKLAATKTIGGVAFDGSGNIVPQTIQSINEATDTTCFPLFISASGTQSLQPLNNASLTFNSNTGVLGATTFSGAGTSLTGTAASLTTGAVTVADAASDTTCWVMLAGSQTGSIAPLSDAGLTYNASTDTLTATAFAGNASGITVADEAADTTCFPVFTTAATGGLGPKTNANLVYNSSTGLLGSSANGFITEYTTTVPATPSAGYNLFARKRANKITPAWVNPQGYINEVSPNMGAKRIGLAVASGGGSTTTASLGQAGTTVTGTATGVTYVGTSIFGAFHRLAAVSAAGAGSSCGVQLNFGTRVARGNATDSGGFYGIARFSIDTIAANMAWFCGFEASGADIGNVDPSSLLNICGFGCDAADTNAQWMVNDGAGTATKVDLGASFPGKTNSVVYEARIFCKPNDTVLYYSLQRFDSAQFTEGNSSADLPVNTTAMNWQLHGGNKAVASAITVGFASFSTESEY